MKTRRRMSIVVLPFILAHFYVGQSRAEYVTSASSLTGVTNTTVTFEDLAGFDGQSLDLASANPGSLIRVLG